MKTPETPVAVPHVVNGDVVMLPPGAIPTQAAQPTPEQTQTPAEADESAAQQGAESEARTTARAKQFKQEARK